jgi:hypothetical protein
MALLVGQRLTASVLNAALNAASWIKYQKTDLIRNNTTSFLSSTDLVFALEANALYAFDSAIIYDTNSTADFQHRWSLPTGATLALAVWTSTPSGTAVDSVVAHDVISSVSYPSGGVAAGTSMSTRPCGVIRMSTTPGDLVIQAAQWVAAVVDTKLKRDSWVTLRKLD